MHNLLRQIAIAIIIFIIVLWFQDKDDIKHKKYRKSLYDKYKLPVLVTAIFGLIFNIDSLNLCESKKDTIFASPSTVNTNTEINVAKPFMNFGKDNSPVMSQEIILDQPDF
jgi:hypothetical protein